MRRSDFDFALPPELIAQLPLATRSDSRLLCLDGATGALSDCGMRQLPALLEPGDLLVFNDTRVVPARLAARKPTGGAVEILLERPLPAHRALVQLRGGKGLAAGTVLSADGGPLIVRARHESLWELEFPLPALQYCAQYGRVPLPPYIAREPDAADVERYQSLLARVPGAVAAPTASLHFDRPLFAELERRGVQRAMVTLHVGAGTFQPLRSEDLGEHRMHPEWYELPASAAQAIAAARLARRRVVAVGTTVVRTLESAAAAAGTGVPAAHAGDTTLFIVPGYRFRVVDALITNFHLPQSTLLMLVSAFAGRAAVLAAYRHAVQARYRFYSYGDAMLVTPASGVRA